MSKKIKPKKCRRCPKSIFNTKDEYIIHVEEQHEGVQFDFFICSECGKQFRTKSELTNHIKSKCGTVKLFKCEVCSQELMTPGSLYNHMRRHKGDPNFMCRFCAKLFLTAGQLKVHERIHTQDKVFVCTVCGKGFCHRQSLITHSTLHTGVKPFLCENCGQTFSCVGNLFKHRRRHANCGLIPLTTTHRVLNPMTKLKIKINTPEGSRLTPVRKKEKTETTSEVKTEITSEVTIKNEENSEKRESTGIDINESNSKEFDEVTEEAEEKFYDDCSNLENPTIHDELTDTSTNNKVIRKKGKRRIKNKELEAFRQKRNIQSGDDFRCKYCSRVYTEARWLFRHEKEFHPSQYNNIEIKEEDRNETHEEAIIKKEDSSKGPFKCHCCKETFEDKEECKLHEVNNHADVLTCNDCEKVFRRPDSLNLHRRIYHKGSPRKTYIYICEHCGKQFKQKTLLLLHEQNNCTDKQIQCDICGKKFTNVHVRKSHMRIHDTENKLQCKICEKKFNWKGQLKIHLRIHTGEKPFTCLYCPKAFAYRESLITHSSLHTGIKPHLCQACGSRFSCIGNLKKHRSTHASTCGKWFATICKD